MKLHDVELGAQQFKIRYVTHKKEEQRKKMPVGREKHLADVQGEAGAVQLSEFQPYSHEVQ